MFRTNSCCFSTHSLFFRFATKFQLWVGVFPSTYFHKDNPTQKKCPVQIIVRFQHIHHFLNLQPNYYSERVFFHPPTIRRTTPHRKNVLHKFLLVFNTFAVFQICNQISTLSGCFSIHLPSEGPHHTEKMSHTNSCWLSTHSLFFGFATKFQL